MNDFDDFHEDMVAMGMTALLGFGVLVGLLAAGLLLAWWLV